MGHEEAIRIHSRCRHLQKLDILSEILQAGLKRSLTKFEQNDKEDEFTDYMLAPDIICKSEMDELLLTVTLEFLLFFYNSKCTNMQSIPFHCRAAGLKIVFF